jgi:hypothetical protein
LKEENTMKHESASRTALLGRGLIQATAIALLGGLLPACNYSNSNHTYTPPPGMGSGTLFLDTFDGGFPGTHWTTPVQTNGTVMVDAATGNPSPSLAFSATSRSATVSTSTQSTFASLQITFSVDLKASSSTLHDVQSILILDTGGGVAARADYDASTGMVGHSVMGGAVVSMSAPVGSFHTVAFHIDGAYNASWSVDGTASSPTPAFYPGGVIGGMVRVGLQASFVSSGAPVATPTFHVDNVKVTSP